MRGPVKGKSGDDEKLLYLKKIRTESKEIIMADRTLNYECCIRLR